MRRTLQAGLAGVERLEIQLHVRPTSPRSISDVRRENVQSHGRFRYGNESKEASAEWLNCLATALLVYASNKERTKNISIKAFVQATRSASS